MKTFLSAIVRAVIPTHPLTKGLLCFATGIAASGTFVASGAPAASETEASRDGNEGVTVAERIEETVLTPVGAYVPAEKTSGAPALWDMGRLGAIADEITALTRWTSDTTFSVTLPGVRRDFSVSGDTVRLHRAETRSIRLESEKGYPVFVAGLSPGTQEEVSDTLSGRIWQLHLIHGHIEAAHRVVASGTLILPGGECHEGVTLSKTVRRMGYVTNDSVYGTESDTLTAYIWTSPGVRFPLAVTLTGGSDRGTATTLVCMPGHNRMTPGKTMRRKVPGQEGYDDGELPGSSAGEPDGSDRMRLHADGTTLTVSLEGGEWLREGNGDTECVVCDALGRVYASGKDITRTMSGLSVRVPVGSLPKGEYIIYVRYGGGEISRKFINH